MLPCSSESGLWSFSGWPSAADDIEPPGDGLSVASGVIE